MRDAAQVRGVLAERVIFGTQLDPYLSLRALAGYSGLSTRTLRTYINRLDGFPHYRIGGKIVVRRSSFDLWMEQFRSQGRPSLARAAREMGLDRA